MRGEIENVRVLCLIEAIVFSSVEWERDLHIKQIQYVVLPSCRDLHFKTYVI